MPTTNLADQSGIAVPARLSCQTSQGHTRLSQATRLGQMMLLAAGLYFCSGVALSAQTSDSGNEWSNDNANLMRTTESRTQSGNRTVDKQSVQRRGLDGHFEPYQDIEKETVQVNATTVRTTTRTFERNVDGAKTLKQVVEEEKRILPGGDSNVVRNISSPDVNGTLWLVKRQIEDTKKTGKNSEETSTTVMFPTGDGGLTAGLKVKELRKQGENGTVESQKTTSLPDGSGNWQVSEVRQATTRQDGKSSTTEERVSRPDSEGKLSEVARTVSRESDGASGGKRKTVENYSADIAGAARDGSLHLVERATTAERTGSGGQQVTEKQVEQPNPANPDAGLQVSAFTTSTTRSGPSGKQSTQTIQARDAHGSFAVVSVDTTKSDNVHAIDLQMAPSDKPK